MRILLSSMAVFVLCDHQLQRAHCFCFNEPKNKKTKTKQTNKKRNRKSSYLSRRTSSTLFPSRLYVWLQTSDETCHCNYKSPRLWFVGAAMLPPTQLCQYKFQCHPRQRGTSWMRANQRHSSKSWQRAHEQRSSDYVYKGAEVRKLNLLLSFT